MTGPLAGTRVVDLTAFASGPLATAVLADQGADVVKVERPGRGDEMRRMSLARGGLSAIFATLNRNKRSLALDLDDPRGKDLLYRLVEGADVFVQNFRPGAIERLGFGEPELRARNRDLVYASISAFGESGPYAQRKVFDSVIQVLAGFAAAQADPGTGEPQLMRTMVCDKTTALAAAQAITAALLARANGRGGQHVRLNMLDASVAFFWVDGMARQTFLAAPGEPADGAPEPGPARPGMTLRRTADGYMTISTVPQDQFEGVCRAMGRPELIEDPRFADAQARMRNVAEMEAVVEEFARAHTTREVSERLEAHGVPHGHVNGPDELVRDPQVVHNRLLAEVEHPAAGRLLLPRPVAAFGDAPREIRRPPPRLGEHGAEILDEIGVPAGEVAALRAAGGVG